VTIVARVTSNRLRTN